MQAKVINGNLNVRKSPSMNSKIIDIIANGTVIEVDTEEKGWCAYQDGYVMAEYLVFFSPPASESPEDTKAKEPTAKKTSAKKTSAKKTSATKKSTTATKKQTAEK